MCIRDRYNPCSRHRPDHLARACAILMETLPASTVCGYVQNIGRDGQKSRVLTLGELVHEPLDMFTTVLIGNAETQAVSYTHLWTNRIHRSL